MRALYGFNVRLLRTVSSYLEDEKIRNMRTAVTCVLPRYEKAGPTNNKSWANHNFQPTFIRARLGSEKRAASFEC
jgi:hypothetical protein